MEGETSNFYYKELKDKILNSNVYSLRSLELNEKSAALLENKSREYIILCKCITIVQAIFELVQSKKYLEAMMVVNLLHEKLGSIKGIPDFGCYTFASYLMVIMSFKLCSLIDMNLSKLQVKEAFSILELLIHSLNRRQTIRPPQIMYNQIIANLNNTVKTVGQKSMKENDITIFKHHLHKIGDKIEFIPSLDMTVLIPKELMKALDDLETNAKILYAFEPKLCSKMNEIYQKVSKEKLKIWIDIESDVRRKDALYDQNMRAEKEIISWVDDS